MTKPTVQASRPNCRIVRFSETPLIISVHWTNENLAMREFHRVLKPGGWFATIWNPRAIKFNPVLIQIEEALDHLVPGLERVSSGRSTFTIELQRHFIDAPNRRMPIYMEGYYTERMSLERYLGIWRSVNDVQRQAGPRRCEQFRTYIESRLAILSEIEATYQTRLWAVQKS